MKHKKPTLTIGIPAFNEEANIGYLIKDLLKQKMSSFILEKIIVSSDGSTDNTVSIVKSIKRTVVSVIDNKDRVGAAGRQNQLLQVSKSDYLLILNADTLILNEYFLEILIKTAIAEKADLVSANLVELQPSSFFEKILATSMQLKKTSFQVFKKGINLYTCYGPARLFSKPLYKSIYFKQSFGEDAYSYLFCLSRNMNYSYAKKAEVFYKLPGTFKDHNKQSHRFLQSQKLMADEFGALLTLKEYYLPYTQLFGQLPLYFLRHPLLTSIYLLLFIYSSLTGIFKLCFQTVGHTWDISASTKQLRRSM